MLLLEESVLAAPTMILKNFFLLNNLFFQEESNVLRVCFMDIASDSHAEEKMGHC